MLFFFKDLHVRYLACEVEDAAVSITPTLQIWLKISEQRAFSSAVEQMILQGHIRMHGATSGALDRCNVLP